MPYKSQQKYDKNLQNNQGNALVIILVMIALIAAVTAVSMRSSNRSSNNMDKETARIQAEALMRQAKSLESAVTQLMTVNQCSENDLNFSNPTTSRVYTNINSPADKRCDIFSMEGAGLTYTNPNNVIFDPNFSGDSDYGQWVFTGSHCILGLGSDDDNVCNSKEVALIALVLHINLSVCLQINELNGIENTGGLPPSDSFDGIGSPFNGQFLATFDPEIGEGASGAKLIKHATGCIESTSGAWGNSYVFYHTLLIR